MHGYDNANRVSSYSDPSKSQSYGYDAFGNMWQSGTASGVPELRPNGPSWYLVNNQVTNRLNSTVYDAGGYEAQLTVANGGTNAFFDAEGRLVQVVLGAVAATYVYDAEDRRVKRTDSGGNATYYVYNAEGQVMAEYAAAPSASGTQYVSTDFLGSMRMLQDSLGNCIMRLDYAPYGAIVPRSGQDCYTAATWNGPLFAGGSHDSATDLDHMGAREYYATLGRFISADPENMGADPATPGSWNMYSYVRNNPLLLIDPSGLYPVVIGNCTYDQTDFYVDGQYDSSEVTGGYCNNSGGSGPEITTQPVPPAPPPQKPPNTQPKQTFSQCMAAHANDFSIAGAVESGINALTGTNTRLRDNLIVGALAGNSITTLLYGSAQDNAAGQIATAPTYVAWGIGSATTYGRRTSDILSLNLVGKGGLPTALSQASGAAKGVIGQAGDILGLGLSFSQKLAIDAGFTAAEAAYCYAVTK